MTTMSFDEFLARPTLCRGCCAPVPSDDVDIDDEGQTVGTCGECRAEAVHLPRGAALVLEDARAMTDARDGTAKERAAFMARSCVAGFDDYRRHHEELVREGCLAYDAGGSVGLITEKGRAALKASR
jgi:hypothetical protein